LTSFHLDMCFTDSKRFGARNELARMENCGPKLFPESTSTNVPEES